MSKVDHQNKVLPF